MKSKKQQLIDAQNEQLAVVANHRVAVLKSLDELFEFNGEDNYEVSLPIIVAAYPDGIMQAQIREVLPDAVKLADAVKTLKGKSIQVVEISARNIQFKPMPQDPVQPTPSEKVESVNTNPTGDPKWESVPSVETQKLVTAK